jgi:uncharacterized protein (DUF1501 family)
MSSPCSCSDHGRLRWKKGATRRDVLKVALGGVGIACLGPLARRLPAAYGAPIPGHKTLVLIYMDGGADTTNMVIPSATSQYPLIRPTIGIDNATSLDLSGGPGTTQYRLHPQFDRLQALWNAGDVALVQKVGYPEENLSHFESQDIHAFAVRNGFLSLPTPVPTSGWVARYASLYAPTPTGAVSVGMGKPRLFMGGTSNPLQVSSLQAFRFNSDSGGGNGNNHLLRVQKIKDMLAQSTATGTPKEVRDAVDLAYQLSDQVQTARTAHTTYLGAGGGPYAGLTDGLTRRMRDVAALVYGGFDTRVFYTGYGGHDTHGDQGGTAGLQPTLIQWLDDAIGAFALDMQNMGRWNDTVICVFTEFGRRNYENLSLGTDHGAGYCMILAGGGVNGGAYGPDVTDADLTEEYLPYAVDFRDVFKEVVSDHLGADPAPVFPEPQPTNVVLGVA